MRKLIGLLLSITLLFTVVLSGCSGDKVSQSDSKSSQEQVIIRVGHVLPETHATHISLAEIFKKEVEEKSKGKITVEIYPNAQLGGDRQEIEAVGLGTLEMCVPAGSVLAGFDEQFMVFDLPFLFKDREAAFNALDSEFGKKIGEGLKDQNIINLGFGENGFRNITNNVRPIHKPQDLDGIKIRTMENPIHMTTFRAFGANPTPMAFGELFTALQQKTVDAQENPVAIIYTSKFYEVQEYLTLSGHVYANCPYLINKDFYENLSEDSRKIVDEAIKNTIEEQRNLTAKQEKEFIDELKKNGMQINELTSEEKDVFIKAAQPAYDEFIKKYGNELVNMAKEYSN